MNLLNVLSVPKGVCIAGRGPTLLDLSEIYGTSVEFMSLMFLFQGVGAPFGSLLSKYIKYFKSVV